MCEAWYCLQGLCGLYLLGSARARDCMHVPSGLELLLALGTNMCYVGPGRFIWHRGLFKYSSRRFGMCLFSWISILSAMSGQVWELGYT